MEWVQIMENGVARYYLIGSRVMGLQHPGSDLDVLSDDKTPLQDFETAGVSLAEFFRAPRKAVVKILTGSADDPYLETGPPKVTEGIDEVMETQEYTEMVLACLPEKTIELQLRPGAVFRKRVWEKVLAQHQKDMRFLSTLPKTERRAGQRALFDNVEAELLAAEEMPS
jgi:hypothetical protein